MFESVNNALDRDEFEIHQSGFNPKSIVLLDLPDRHSQFVE